MATRAHQFIAELIARKMNIDGFEVISFDGLSESERTKLKIPPKIIRHRPDLLGIDRQKNICIGEAKTAGDMGPRTQEQLEDFSSIGVRFYIGIPSSAEWELEKMLKKYVQPNNGLVLVVKVPDRLLPGEDHD